MVEREGQSCIEHERLMKLSSGKQVGESRMLYGRYEMYRNLSKRRGSRTKNTSGTARDRANNR